MASSPHRAPRCVGATFAALLVLSARAASAQNPPSDEAEARRLFERGVALIDADHPAEAITLLEQARRIREVPAVVYNLALAQSAVGRFADSLASFDAYLRLAGARLPAGRRAEIDGLIATARQSAAVVTLRVSGPTVAVTVDDVALAPARLQRPLELDPGRHVFQATGPGMQPLEVTRHLASGARLEIDLAPTLLPTTGTLGVASLIPGASIYIDGTLAGFGAIERTTPPGRHTVVLRADGYDPAESVVQLRPGQTERLRLSLTRRTSLLTQWWFWTGAGVAVTALVVGLVVGLSSTEALTGGTQHYVVEAITGR